MTTLNNVSSTVHVVSYLDMTQICCKFYLPIVKRWVTKIEGTVEASAINGDSWTSRVAVLVGWDTNLCVVDLSVSKLLYFKHSCRIDFIFANILKLCVCLNQKLCHERTYRSCAQIMV